MNDTVTRLMELADDYAIAYHLANPKDQPRWMEMVQKRQALQEELVRLFTPLSDEQIERMSSVAPAGSDDWIHLSPWDYKRELERARAAGIRIAEQAHTVADDPCPGCQKGTVCRTFACGRLKLKSEK